MEKFPPMLKPLTFSVSLAVALGTCSLGMAGHGKSLPSGQCEAPSAQCASPSPQGCGDICGPVAKKHCFSLPHFQMPHISMPKCDLFKHKPKCVEYEWVLRKKKSHPFKGLLGGHGGDACGGCGDPVYATGQTASPQGGAWGSGQGGSVYGSGQIGGSGQVPAGQVSPPSVPSTDAAPEVPDAPPAASAPTASTGSLLFLAPAGN
jgi:hypothetical protein